MKNKLIKWLTILACALVAIGFTACVDTPSKPNSSPKPTSGIVYTISEDGSYAEVVKYNGSEAEVIIADTYENKPVTSIGDRAFVSSHYMESITIPSSITSIGENAFDNCSYLKNVYITDMAAWCNITFNDKNSNPFCFADNFYLNNNLVTELVIPDKVTEIKDYAFYPYNQLTSITIPASVTSIGNSPFCDSYSTLQNVYITDLAAWCNISFSANTSNPLCFAKNFYVNNQLATELVLPNTVTQIKGHTFFNLDQLTSITIPSSVKTIDEGAFANCQGLESINIPDSVTSIGEYAFALCYGLTNASIGNSVTSVGKGAFDFCEKLQFNVYDNANYLGNENNPYLALIETVDANRPSYTIHSDTKIIADYAFADCKKMTDITLPDSVAFIGENAFENCKSLQNLYIKDIAAWCNISFHNSVSNPFLYAEKLYVNNTLTTDLVIPDTITEIKDYAFYNCSGLTSVAFPSSVTSIGDYAFTGCENLTSVSISDVAAWCNISFAKEDCNPLYYAGKLYLNDTLMTDLVIPDTITEIKDYAFYNCSNLTSVTIPSSVTSIGNLAFNLCNYLTSVFITDIESWCKMSIASNPLTLANNLYVNGELLTDLVIPDTVTEIKDGTFCGCTPLTSITIPDSVTSIGDSAFFLCSNVTSVYYTGDIESWLKMSFGSHAHISAKTLQLYINNELLTNLVIPNTITEIKDYTFFNCDSLTSVTIPSSVTSIGNSAFSGCSNLKSITIPNSVTSIGKSAFGHCDSLTSLTIPDSVTTIGDYAFYDCENLTSIAFPNSVTAIGYAIFYSCDNLTSVTIPSSVTSIDQDAFMYCNNLHEIIFGGTKEQWKAIKKGSLQYTISASKIVCIDGEITL